MHCLLLPHSDARFEFKAWGVCSKRVIKEHSSERRVLSTVSLFASMFDRLFFSCLFWGFSLLRKLFTHMETSPLRVKGFKF